MSIKMSTRRCIVTVYWHWHHGLIVWVSIRPNRFYNEAIQNKRVLWSQNYISSHHYVFNAGKTYPEYVYIILYYLLTDIYDFDPPFLSCGSQIYSISIVHGQGRVPLLPLRPYNSHLQQKNTLSCFKTILPNVTYLLILWCF